MNCYNSDSFLREAIDSVYAQSFEDWEIVFWDNQSTDESARIAKGYDQRLRYLRGTEFLSLGEARNRALTEARGEYVAILDCDDVWKPEKLEKQIAVFESEPEVGVVYSNCDIVDRNGKLVGPMLSPSQFYRGDVFEPLLLFKFFPPWPTVIFQKWAGEFFKPYKIVEDYDLLLRIAHRLPFAYVPDSLAKYRTHQGQAFRDFELTLKEQLSVCEYWGKQPEFNQPDGRRLIRKSRARSFLSAGTASLYGELDSRKVRRYFWRSLNESISGRALGYFLVSFIGLRRARRFLGGLRSKLGYSPNLHIAPTKLEAE